MNTWTIIPLITCISYIILFIWALQSVNRRVNRLFCFYLAISATWSFTSFMLHLNAFPQQALLWNELLGVALPWSLITYYHFIRAYVNKPAGKGILILYVILVGFAILSLSGNVIRSVYVLDGVVYQDVGIASYLVGFFSITPVIAGLLSLIKKYRSSSDHSERNRTAYLIAGWSVLMLLGYTNLIPALAKFPLDHIGSLLNALIIAYAIRKYNLLDIKIVIRRGLVYSTLTIFLTTCYLLLLFTIQILFQGWLGYSSLAIAFGFALVAAVLFNPVRNIIQRWIDRIFYRETYDYRQMLLHFSDKISNVLDLEELTQSILDPVVNAMHVKQASLLFPENGTGDFRTRFTKQADNDEPLPKLKLTVDNPIVYWLEKEAKAFRQKYIDILPELKGLWEVERVAISVLGVELLCPIRSKGNLIGILALGEKHSGAPYSDEEIDLLMTMANEAAMALENARMLDSLKSQQLQVEQLLGQVVLAQEEERNRISIDLHDSVAQWLVAASYGMQAFRQSLPPGEVDRARDELNDMEQTVTRSLRELRRVVIGLRPPALDELGLNHALKKSLDDYKRDGVIYKYTQTGEPRRLPSSMEITTYRIVQEALANVRKHSNATRVTLRVDFRDDGLLVEIRDNGQGFNLPSTLDSAISVGHLGLLGMKQRVDMLGGEINIKTSEGKGTIITVDLPIQIPVEER